MLNRSFIWNELYRLTPGAVERCACVWQLNGARRALRRALAEQNERLIESMLELPAPPESPESPDQAQTQAVDPALFDPEEQLRQLDAKYRVPRRRTWVTLVVVGALMTLQPWLSIGWFAMVILLSGLMLCALEFSPKTGEGFVAMVLRLRKDAK